MSNEDIVRWVRALGGDCVCEDDLFAISLLDVAIEGSGVERLVGLQGLDQLAIDASRLGREDLQRLAAMEGLSSLVVAGRQLSSAELAELCALGPEVDQVAPQP